MRYYVSTSESSINRNSLPFRLFEKAKKLGTWDPQDIDFSKDREDWEESYTGAARSDFAVDRIFLQCRGSGYTRHPSVNLRDFKVRTFGRGNVFDDVCF